jgi:hypothetical protein
MCVKGKASFDECFIAWEKILKRNGEVNNDYGYSNIFAKESAYARYYHEYLYTKTIILYLLTVIDDNYIAILASKGYKIDLKSERTYVNSLHLALRKCDNLITKMVMKQKELTNNDKTYYQPPNLEQLIASISYELGFEVKETITLARFNEYKKIISKKHKEINQNPFLYGGNRKR